MERHPRDTLNEKQLSWVLRCEAIFGKSEREEGYATIAADARSEPPLFVWRVPVSFANIWVFQPGCTDCDSTKKLSVGEIKAYGLTHQAFWGHRHKTFVTLHPDGRAEGWEEFERFFVEALILEVR
jgi:hypothetical protein